MDCSAAILAFVSLDVAEDEGISEADVVAATTPGARAAILTCTLAPCASGCNSPAKTLLTASVLLFPLPGSVAAIASI